MAGGAADGADGHHQFAPTGCVGLAHDLRHVRIARGLGDDLHLERRTIGVELIEHAFGRALDQRIAHVAGDAQLGGQGQQGLEILRDDRADDRFLVLEIVVDMTGAHAGDLRDLCDARAMKAVLAKALCGGGEDLLATGGGARSVGGMGRGVRDLQAVPIRRSRSPSMNYQGEAMS